MKNRVIIILLTSLALISCSSSALTPYLTDNGNSPSETLAIATGTVKPKITASPPATPKPTITPAPTIEFPPYPTKQVILEYGYQGDHSVFDSILGNASTIFLVLYSDGQLIVSGINSPILTQKLSKHETDQLFVQLSSKGFYSVETNQKHDPSDHLYYFGDHYQESFDGLFYYVSTNEKQSRLICVYGPERDLLIPQMEDVLQFLGNYVPDHLTKYQPDRILVFVVKGANGFTNETVTSMPWPTDLPLLETISHQQIAYFDGEAANKIFSLFAYSWDAKVFNQNDMDYSVFVYVVLPHENLSRPQEWTCSK